MTQSKKIAPPPGKRERIIEALKDHCAEFGFDQISVRSVAKRADVNSAMLGYYIGSKDQLMRTLIVSVTETLGSYRMQALDALRARHDGPLPLEDIIRIQAEPILTPNHKLQRDVRVHYNILGRIVTDPDSPLADFAQQCMIEAHATLVKEIGRSAPHVPSQGIAFRYVMMVGALNVLGGRPGLVGALTKKRGAVKPGELLDRFVSDWAGQFEAPWR